VVIPNQPPTALFSYEPENPKVNQSVSFDASDSFDPDGEVVDYRWDFDGDEVVDTTGKTAKGLPRNKLISFM
jgi:PKD repeat protein